METLSHRLARHVIQTRYDDLPPAAIDAAKKSLLDAIGVSLAASRLGEGCAAFVELARAAGGKPEATLVGFGDKVAARDAALANGAMAHAIDYEDAFDGAPLHPSAAMIPAALAIAEARGGVSGREFIAALAVGCDLVCRIGLCLTSPIDAFGWYAPPMFGAYGATAAAGRLAGLGAEQLVDAFSLTLCQSTCSGEIKVSPNSLIRAVRDAFAAQAGVLSAQLAALGVAGFERPFEGGAGFFQLYGRGLYDPAVLTAELGRRFHGDGVSYKAWPSCRGTHAFIEAALKVRGEVALGDIAEVRLGGTPLQRMLIEPTEQKRAPKTAIDAKFSLPFTVATALLDGRVTLDDFTPAALARPDVLTLAPKVSYEVIGDWGPDRMASGRTALVLADGSRREVEIAQAFGHPTNPMSTEALVAKFRDCAARAARPYDAASIDRLATRILDLETLTDVGAELFADLTLAEGATP